MAALGPHALKDRFTSLDTLALVRELRALGRLRVDKAFDARPEGWSITFRVPGEGRHELLLVPGRFAALLTDGIDHAEELGPLAKELRRLLSGGVLTDVRDPRGERYLELEVQRSDSAEPLVLAVELFGTGNVLVARGPKIVAVAHARTWAHRTVRVGAAYVRPPQRSNPWTTSEVELEAALAQSRTDRVSTLAARLAFGGPVAEELLYRAGVAPSEPAPLDASRVARELHRAIGELLTDVGERPRGFLYRREAVPVDVEPYASRRWSAEAGVESVARATFSEAAREYFASLPSPVPKATTPTSDARAELTRTRERQRAAIEQLGREAEEEIAKAEAIYAHYDVAERALTEASTSPEAGGASVDVDLGGRTVPLLRHRPLRESAQQRFEEAKRIQAKVAGARSALAETEARLRNVPTLETAPSAVATAAVRRHKPHWFEKHRWFLSSEGVVVIGGRDAASNDLIVRRYLNARDLYVHADIHGAASVIVKQPPPDRPPAGEVTLREAAQWAVAFSKAWRGGLASASAFWVHADQVSKAGASGEFVARGAWVVHGTKNVLRDLPLELAVGTVDYEGDAIWTVAPPGALRARGTVLVLLAPGDERTRPEREVELAKLLGLSRDRLQSLLPAGGITWRRA
ncbi:MAG: ribosome rescue protein RqcH [Thermoplasmata archaeon]